jgi:hypothetical protein
MSFSPTRPSGAECIITTDFFAYLPARVPDPDAISRIQQVLHELGYSTVTSPTLLGCVTRSAPEEWNGPWSQILHITRGTQAATQRSGLLRVRNEDLNNVVADTVRVFNIIRNCQDSLEIFSDPLGVLPYYWASLPSGVVVASSLRHLLVAFPHLGREIDDQGVFEFLCCGTPFANRTLHRHIRLSSAGQVIHWNKNEDARFSRRGRLVAPRADFGVAAARAADQIAGHIRESLQKLPCPALLPLTGGFDSRLIAVFATSLNLHPSMVTIGYRSHDEVRIARCVARLLGDNTTVIAPKYPRILDLLPTWLECSVGLADAQSLFVANLLYLPNEDGTPIYHGFIGDTLSGAKLNAVGLERATTAEDTAAGIINYFLNDISPLAPEALHLSASREQAMQDVLAELLPDVAPHQAFMVWNLETIQRRLVGQQLPLLGKRFMPLPVFYYKPLMELWLSLPRMALDYRFLLGNLFKQFSPELESLPHAEHVPERIPRNIPGFQYLMGWAARHYGVKALRKLGLGADRLENHWYIWAMWHGITPKEKQRELERLLGTATLFESRLGWNAPRPDDAVWTRCTATTHRQLLLLRRMHLLGEYAQSLSAPDNVVAAEAALDKLVT